MAQREGKGRVREKRDAELPTSVAEAPAKGMMNRLISGGKY